MCNKIFLIVADDSFYDSRLDPVAFLGVTVKENDVASLLDEVEHSVSKAGT